MAQLTGGHSNRQRQARQLTARSHFANRLGRGAWVACHQKLHAVDAMRAGLCQLVQLHFKPAALHAQTLHGLGDGARELGGCLGALLRQLACSGLVGLVSALLGFAQGVNIDYSI